MQSTVNRGDSRIHSRLYPGLTKCLFSSWMLAISTRLRGCMVIRGDLFSRREIEQGREIKTGSCCFNWAFL